MKTVLSDERIGDIWHTYNNFEEQARAIEKAVLESPEIQALQDDESRLDFIAEDDCVFTTWIQEDYTVLYRLEWNHGEEWQKEWFRSPREAIDAAIKEQQK